MSENERAAFILNSDKPVAIHQYPKEWRSPFMAGFGLTCGAASAFSLIAIGLRILRFIWERFA